ncbi:MAG: FlxA-like family protein [Thermodesulfobacteriota bacterium]|nr:MAG: FlxA-like family protein [Thermodesulfobacteriota bacterium]
MKGIKRIGYGIAAFSLLFGIYTPVNAADEKRDEELERINSQVEVLTEEIEKLKLGGVAEPDYASFSGLGPAASKVYGVGKGLSLGGYGEIVYSNYQSSTKKDLIDTYRFILYAGYKFNDWIVMNTELEFEHVNEVSVEFSYIDFLFDKKFNIRSGLMLVPVGVTNEWHEPTVYNGVFRPEVESKIIPSTWRDIGIMAHGEYNGFSYKAAVLNGMRSGNFGDSDWIRGGRYKGKKANADNLAYVLNINYDINPALRVGGSYYTGRAAEGLGGAAVTANEKEATVNLWELHARYRYKGLDLRGLFVRGTLDGNSDFEAAPPGNVGKAAQGWYAEAAYDIMPLLKGGTESSLSPFVRYEAYDTHEEVFAGTPDPVQDRTVTTAGVSYKPIPYVVIKADYQWKDTASGLPAGKGAGLDENKVDQANLGIGFIF